MHFVFIFFFSFGDAVQEFLNWLTSVDENGKHCSYGCPNPIDDDMFNECVAFASQF